MVSVSLPRHEGRRWLLAGAVACAIVIAGAWPSLPPTVRDWDNAVKLQVAWNILHGRGPILTEHTPDDRSYVLIGTDGRAYTYFPLVASILHFVTLGIMATGGPLAEGAPDIVLLGLLAWSLVAWARRSGASPPAAAAGAMLVCFGTALWPMAAFGYDNLVEAVGLSVVLWAGAGDARPRAWIWAGLAVGAAFATRVGAVSLVVPAALLVVLQAPRRLESIAGRGAAFALGCTPGVALTLWYNHLRFGDPFSFSAAAGIGTLLGKSREQFVPWFSTHYWQAIAGLTVSPGKGLLWYGLPLLGVVILARPLFRRWTASFSALAAYSAANLLLLAHLVFWHGEWCWGPRYVAPLYLATAPLAWWLWKRFEHRGAPAGAIAAAAFAALVAVQAFPVVSDPVVFHLRVTVQALANAGRLVSSPIDWPPLPRDNGVLYFRIENSPLVSLVRLYSSYLGDPAVAARVRVALTRAMLAPALAIAFTVLVALLLRQRAGVGAAGPAAPGPAGTSRDDGER